MKCPNANGRGGVGSESAFVINLVAHARSGSRAASCSGQTSTIDATRPVRLRDLIIDWAHDVARGTSVDQT
jgi:hypothetical protein